MRFKKNIIYIYNYTNNMCRTQFDEKKQKIKNIFQNQNIKNSGWIDSLIKNLVTFQIVYNMFSR